MTDVSIPSYTAAWGRSLFAGIDLPAWLVVEQAEAVIRKASAGVGDDYEWHGDFAVHPTATIETGVVLKGPGIIGPRCLVAAGSYLRGGVYVGADCIIGPSCELKSSFMFAGSKIAHFNFVGDTIIGLDVNVEAGAIVANYRNELLDKAIRIRSENGVIETGVQKFGALIGDEARIGANAVIAPGALIAPGTKIGRLQLVDQYPH